VPVYVDKVVTVEKVVERVVEVPVEKVNIFLTNTERQPVKHVIAVMTPTF
jgi:hypothetical protein